MISLHCHVFCLPVISTPLPYHNFVDIDDILSWSIPSCFLVFLLFTWSISLTWLLSLVVLFVWLVVKPPNACLVMAKLLAVIVFWFSSGQATVVFTLTIVAPHIYSAISLCDGINS